MKTSLFARLSLSCAAAIILAACNDGPPEIKVKPTAPVEVVEVVETVDPAALFEQRKTDLAELNAALEQHYNITGTYPETNGGNWASVFHSQSAPTTAWIPGLVPNYIAETPVDPDSTVDPKSPQYLYKSNGVGFKLIAHLTGDCAMLSDLDAAKADPKRSNGGACWGWGYFTPDYASL